MQMLTRSFWMQDGRCQPYEEMAQSFAQNEGVAAAGNEERRDDTTSAAEDVRYYVVTYLFVYCFSYSLCCNFCIYSFFPCCFCNHFLGE